jgi:hypothetical protein
MTERADRVTGRAARRRARAEEEAREDAYWELTLSRLERGPGERDDPQRARERDAEIRRLTAESTRYWNAEHRRLTRGGPVRRLLRALFT